MGMARHRARVDGGLPSRRVRRGGTQPARRGPSLCARKRARAVPVPTGRVHGAFRLSPLRRRTGARRLARRGERHRERPVPLPSRAPHVISVPLWLAIAVGVLAAWAAYEHIVVPALRWLVTHPANQVIDDVSSRLRIGIRPFQRTRRQALVHRLLTDPKVQQAAEQCAQREGVPVLAALKRVERYAREIVPAFNAYLYFRLAYWLGRGIARALYRVRLGYIDAEGIGRIDADATVVLVMNHRSNMDYILAGFMAAEQAALSYAVGEWARIWPLSALMRAMGAYFVRRNSGDELYRRVLERYIVMATEAGVPQAVFPEGGLSRDGRMREPRLGVLDYMMRGFHLGGDRDLVFVPLGINYDRVLEDRTLLRSGEGQSTLQAIWAVLRFLGRNLRLVLRGEWHRYGYACVNFGPPLSMREIGRASCRERVK